MRRVRCTSPKETLNARDAATEVSLALLSLLGVGLQHFVRPFPCDRRCIVADNQHEMKPQL